MGSVITNEFQYARRHCCRVEASDIGVATEIQICDPFYASDPLKLNKKYDLPPYEVLSVEHSDNSVNEIHIINPTGSKFQHVPYKPPTEENNKYTLDEKEAVLISSSRDFVSIYDIMTDINDIPTGLSTAGTTPDKISYGDDQRHQPALSLSDSIDFSDIKVNNNHTPVTSASVLKSNPGNTFSQSEQEQQQQSGFKFNPNAMSFQPGVKKRPMNHSNKGVLSGASPYQPSNGVGGVVRVPSPVSGKMHKTDENVPYYVTLDDVYVFDSDDIMFHRVLDFLSSQVIHSAGIVGLKVHDLPDYFNKIAMEKGADVRFQRPSSYNNLSDYVEALLKGISMKQRHSIYTKIVIHTPSEVSSATSLLHGQIASKVIRNNKQSNHVRVTNASATASAAVAVARDDRKRRESKTPDKVINEHGQLAHDIMISFDLYNYTLKLRVFRDLIVFVVNSFTQATCGSNSEYKNCFVPYSIMSSLWNILYDGVLDGISFEDAQKLCNIDHFLTFLASVPELSVVQNQESKEIYLNLRDSKISHVFLNGDVYKAFHSVLELSLSPNVEEDSLAVLVQSDRFAVIRKEGVDKDKLNNHNFTEILRRFKSNVQIFADNKVDLQSTPQQPKPLKRGPSIFRQDSSFNFMSSPQVINGPLLDPIQQQPPPPPPPVAVSDNKSVLNAYQNLINSLSSASPEEIAKLISKDPALMSFIANKQNTESMSPTSITPMNKEVTSKPSLNSSTGVITEPSELLRLLAALVYEVIVGNRTRFKNPSFIRIPIANLGHEWSLQYKVLCPLAFYLNNFGIMNLAEFLSKSDVLVVDEPWVSHKLLLTEGSSPLGLQPSPNIKPQKHEEQQHQSVFNLSAGELAFHLKKLLYAIIAEKCQHEQISIIETQSATDPRMKELHDRYLQMQNDLAIIFRKRRKSQTNFLLESEDNEQRQDAFLNFHEIQESKQELVSLLKSLPQPVIGMPIADVKAEWFKHYKCQLQPLLEKTGIKKISKFVSTIPNLKVIGEAGDMRVVVDIGPPRKKSYLLPTPNDEEETRIDTDINSTVSYVQGLSRMLTADDKKTTTNKQSNKQSKQKKDKQSKQSLLENNRKNKAANDIKNMVGNITTKTNTFITTATMNTNELGPIMDQHIDTENKYYNITAMLAVSNLVCSENTNKFPVLAAVSVDLIRPSKKPTVHV